MAGSRTGLDHSHLLWVEISELLSKAAYLGS